MTGRVLICGLVLMAGVAATAAAQPGAAATIRGRVLDPQGQGVIARVQIVPARTGLERDTQSDAAGYFALTNIQPGDVALVATAPGFAEHRIARIQLEVGQSADVEIELR